MALLSAKAGEAPQRDAPAVQAVRRELLEAALPYYEEFLRERDGDPTLRAELADAHFHIAEIAAVTGPRSKAQESYGRAQALYEDLLRGESTNAAHRAALAEVHARLGVLHAAAGRPAEALAAYQDARRALVDELGIEPGKELRDLHQAMLNQDAALDLPRKEERPREAAPRAPGACGRSASRKSGAPCGFRLPRQHFKTLANPAR